MRTTRWFVLVVLLLVIGLMLAVVPAATAATDCSFTVKKDTMRLDGDCWTDETIVVPDGMTLDGRGHTITAVDPMGGHFTGAVVANGGDEAHVRNLTVTTAGLSNVCDGGDDRLRGIMFDGASGSITHSTVVGINQGPSGCQEGNAIEVRNAPFDGTHPGTVAVEVAYNVVDDYQKTGIVANGDVDVDVHHNRLSASATQDNLAANTIQIGFGALGSATNNTLDGNQWKGTSDFVATAILVYQSGPVDVSKNHIGGNSDIGIYFFADDGTVTKNHIVDEGPDDPDSGYDIGLGDWGTGNTVTKNHVRGFDVPFDPASLTDFKNKALPSS